MIESQKIDLQFGCLIIGSRLAGKTTFFCRLSNTNPQFIGLDFKNVIVHSHGNVVRLKLNDIQNRFSCFMGNNLYRGITIIFLVYDITNHASFEEIAKVYLRDIENRAPTAMKVLIGNKNDLQGREVSEEEGYKLAMENDMLFMEGSALTGQNLTNCLSIVVDWLLEENMDKLQGMKKISLKSSVIGGNKVNSSSCW